MKKEPSCCLLRYELPSLKPKMPQCCSLQRLGFCCTDLEGLAGATLTSLAALLVMFPAHTNNICVGWVLPRLCCCLGLTQSWGLLLPHEDRLQTEASLKPRLYAVLGAVTEGHFACCFAHKGSQDSSATSPTGTFTLLSLRPSHPADPSGQAPRGIC